MGAEPCLCAENFETEFCFGAVGGSVWRSASDLQLRRDSDIDCDSQGRGEQGRERELFDFDSCDGRGFHFGDVFAAGAPICDFASGGRFCNGFVRRCADKLCNAW